MRSCIASGSADGGIRCIVHLAAMTDVEECEADKKSAFNANVRGTVYLASICNHYKIPLIYVSTNHVFSGSKDNYKEIDAPAPLNVYGFTKWQGELSVKTFCDDYIIVRTSSIFDSSKLQPELDNMKNGVSQSFPGFIVRSYLHRTHFCNSIEYICNSLLNIPRGIINIASANSMSKYDFMVNCANIIGFDPSNIQRRSSEDTRYVKRPLNGSLNIRKAWKLGIPIYSILDGIKLLESEIANEI